MKFAVLYFPFKDGLNVLCSKLENVSTLSDAVDISKNLET